MISILHVVESYGGGVSSALASYVRSTPHAEHHLLCTDRIEALADSGHKELFASVRSMPQNAVAAMMSIRAATNSVRPTIVHAHSSWAGVFTRLCLRNRPDRWLVYTPHCFAFERTDIRPWKRRLFSLAELILSLNTEIIAACSARERDLGKEMRARSGAVFVPNAIATRDAAVSHRRHRALPQLPVLAAVGRLSAQKDPQFFLDVVRLIRKRHSHFEAKWIGDGLPSIRHLLESEDIGVTGWLPQEDVMRQMESVDVYLHTAAWEGFPMSILEAAKAGLPIAARKIDALSDAPKTVAVQQPSDLADICVQLLAGEKSRDLNRHYWANYLSPNTPGNQSSILTKIYSKNLDSL